VDEELEKIQILFTEAGQKWDAGPKLVLSRAFFEAWENAYQPIPFAIPEETSDLLDGRFALVHDHSRIAACAWDPDEECPMVVVEGATTSQRFLIMFCEGGEEVVECPVTFLEDSDVTYGERLEVVYDVMSYIRIHRPDLDVREITLADYREALEELALNYEPRCAKVMGKLTRASIRKMIERAVEDMAADEVSNQLILPLGGTYAMGEVRDPTMKSSTMRETRLAGQTPWPIARELAFIVEAFEKLSGMSEHYVIMLSTASILQDKDPRHLILKVPLQDHMPLSDGDFLPVFMRGEKAPVANLRVDLNEGEYCIASLMWNDRPLCDALDGALYARPRRGPARYISQLLTAMQTEYRKGSTFESASLRAIFGVGDLVLQDSPEADGSSNDLDPTQKRALHNALNDNNPLVLIQGPPGTGKTHVLETVLRELSRAGKRVLVTAPSNAAVDNVCRRIFDLPALRVGKQKESIAVDVLDKCWIHNPDAIRSFKHKRQRLGSVFAGTHIGILRAELITADLEQNGRYDAIIFDEAGMANLGEFILCSKLAERAILFGDHQQLPPFPLPDEVVQHLREYTVADRTMWAAVEMSALQWLIEERKLPVYLLRSSYRCQNPRLMRFSSILFYNARVRASSSAEYYTLSFEERMRIFPPSTLRLFRTSDLPLSVRRERLVLTGKRPGLENPLEAHVVVDVFYQYIRRYPLKEITIITPYRRQVRLIRNSLSLAAVREITQNRNLTENVWEHFLRSRISTVDSFQGGESDVVIICYVRSNEGYGIGFVDDPNRINVAHTRCRREMAIVADIDCLKSQARNQIPVRMERAIIRDGEIIDVKDPGPLR
jgi:hypothetical protein